MDEDEQSLNQEQMDHVNKKLSVNIDCSQPLSDFQSSMPSAPTVATGTTRHAHTHTTHNTHSLTHSRTHSLTHSLIHTHYDSRDDHYDTPHDHYDHYDTPHDH